MGRRTDHLRANDRESEKKKETVLLCPIAEQTNTHEKILIASMHITPTLVLAIRTTRVLNTLLLLLEELLVVHTENKYHNIMI